MNREKEIYKVTLVGSAGKFGRETLVTIHMEPKKS